jgi:hypothetical protein
MIKNELHSTEGHFRYISNLIGTCPVWRALLLLFCPAKRFLVRDQCHLGGDMQVQFFNEIEC